MSKPTTLLRECPFDWVEQMHQENPTWSLLRSSEKLPWYFRAWHWHIKKWVEPFYPNSIYRLGIRIYQRIRYGYCYSDFWGLDHTLGRFILPRLKEFRRRAGDPNIISGYPIDMDPCFNDKPYNGCHCNQEHWEKWYAILDEMIYAFEIMMLDGESHDFNRFIQADEEKVKRGMKYFAEYFESLWE